MQKVDSIVKSFDGNMSDIGNMMGTNNDMIPTEDIIDADVTEITSDKIEDKSNIIKTVTPFTIVSREKNGKNVATLSFLCLDGNDELFTLNRNYVLDEEDNEIIKLIDFHVECMYPNAIICNQLITNHLPCYISDFKFEVENLKDNRVFLNATETRKMTVKKFEFDPEVYAALNFIDDYIFGEDIENDYDLRLATAIGSKENDNVEFFVIDSIDNITSMVSIDTHSNNIFDKIKDVFSKDESTSIGLVFRASRFISKAERETISLLTPFDIGVVLDKSKFKGDTIKSLQENYYGDSDQYVSTLIADESRIYGIDKEYLMIRGKNKNGIIKIFLLDQNIKADLIHKIKEY